LADRGLRSQHYARQRAADAQHLMDGLASGRARAAAAEEEIGRIKCELAAAVARAQAAERRARAAEFDNLQVAGHVLLGTKSETPSLQVELTRLNAEIDALHRSISWRVTAPLRALRRTFIHSTAATRRGRRRS
jgi:hypothetical protein